MSDLRELIAGRIWHDDWVKNVGEEPPYPWDSEQYEDGLSGGVDAEYRDTADRIIELVREALLSDAAVESCLIAVGCGACEYYGDESAPCYQSCRKINRQGITAALDAALGGDGHE